MHTVLSHDIIDEAQSAIEWEVFHSIALLDQPVSIHLTGLPPNKLTLIKLQTCDDKEQKWSSYGIFQADLMGRVDLTTASPIQGTYVGVDPMGLFWSMAPESRQPEMFKKNSEQITMTLSAYCDGKLVASMPIVRLRKSPDVERISVSKQGLVGTLFLPPSDQPLPVILSLSGSNGGLSENRAQLLASHGFAVLALGYFGVEGLPSHLENIPIEYFARAFNWIKEQPNLDSSHIGLFGISRGAELALILGTLFPDSIQAIVATAPSSVINGGLGKERVPAWIFHGSPVGPDAPVPKSDLNKEMGQHPDRPLTTTPLFLKAMENHNEFSAAAIPVEKIQCPILLISGGDDQMWPSSLFAELIRERLDKQSWELSCTHLAYPKAGHQINIPYFPHSGPLYFHPVGNLWFSMGGSAQEDDLASRDSWDKLIQFFEDALYPDIL